MTEKQDQFDLIAQEGRVIRSARMLNEGQALTPAQRKDIVERCLKFLEENNIKQAQLGREIGLSSTSVSEMLRLRYKGATSDKHLVRINNWLELAARRDTIVRSRAFVETAVASEILSVARVVAETCKIGVVFGPAQIGKSFTLQAIEGDQSFGAPVLVRVDESRRRPFALCREVCTKFELSVNGTFDAVFRRLVARLAGTKRMLIFDEAERATFEALEWVRDFHDQTGSPIFFCGKPRIYEKLGFRQADDFNEVTDQLAGRIVIRRDLTERTREGKNPEPLFRLADVRALIRGSGLQLRVSKDAERWLQSRASALGQGGIGKAMVALYLGAKVAYARGDEVLTSTHLEDVDDLAMGHEDAARIAEAVAESSGMRRVV